MRVHGASLQELPRWAAGRAATLAEMRVDRANLQELPSGAEVEPATLAEMRVHRANLQELPGGVGRPGRPDRTGSPTDPANLRALAEDELKGGLAHARYVNGSAAR